MDDSVRASAIAYATEHYPLAELVVVAGSAASTRRPLSDIDLLVIGPAAMFPGDADEAAHTDRWNGELFEVFASTPRAFRRHQEASAARARPVSGQLLADGVVVLDRGVHDDLVAWNRRLLDAGPEVTARDLDLRRYGVTNALDDLLDTTDRVERAVLAAFLFERLAEFLLLADGRWLGSGRWLLRRLMDRDLTSASALGGALAATDVAELERLTLEALAPYGGRLMEGFRR